ncbi:MAG: hypothetical protein HWN66_18600, partial [Candidatus Helarchaeota archaeon]|nr:hypothetical protein [Candidatus Helarchaeota archaeon]
MLKRRVFPIFLLFSLFFLGSAFLTSTFAYGDNPNDPHLRDQWGWLNVYADVAYSNGYRGNSTTIVAVIDSGIDLDHPDLQANIFTNLNDPPG